MIAVSRKSWILGIFLRNVWEVFQVYLINIRKEGKESDFQAKSQIKKIEMQKAERGMILQAVCSN